MKEKWPLSAFMYELPYFAVYVMTGLALSAMSYHFGKLGAKQGTEEALTFINKNWGNPNA